MDIRGHSLAKLVRSMHNCLRNKQPNPCHQYTAILSANLRQHTVLKSSTSPLHRLSSLSSVSSHTTEKNRTSDGRETVLCKFSEWALSPKTVEIRNSSAKQSLFSELQGSAREK